jgi:hypothetical protein
MVAELASKNAALEAEVSELGALKGQVEAITAALARLDPASATRERAASVGSPR